MSNTRAVFRVVGGLLQIMATVMIVVAAIMVNYLRPPITAQMIYGLYIFIALAFAGILLQKL